MDHDLRALYEILDCQIVKGKPEDEFRGYLSTLERKYENQKEFIRSLECNSHVGLEEDKLSNALIPEDLPSSADKIYKAVKTTGNGDCLYNAVSLALVGDESYAILLRLLVALELAINVSFYAQHPKFTYFPSGGRHPNTVFSLCLTRRGNDVFHDSAQNRELAVFSEARTASQPKEWSGYFQVSALSAVLVRPVFSSYPNCPSWTRDFVHGIVYPRMATFSSETVFLLWTREGSDNRPGAWFEPNHFVPLFSVTRNGKGQNTIKETTQAGSLKKKAMPPPISGEIRKVKTSKTDDKGTNSGMKKGCLEQFGFRSKARSLKKPKKEDSPSTMSGSEEEQTSNIPKREFVTTAEGSKSSEDKKSNYEVKRVRKFQWNWLASFPWLRVNTRYLSSNEQYDLMYPYPQVQPPTCEVYSMYCSVCSQHSQSSSVNDISKKCGSRVFKMETLKKHDKSQSHANCVESLKARQKPQERPFVKSLNKLINAKDPKLEKKILQHLPL